MRDGGWAAVVGMPALGYVAAAEHEGIDLGRLAIVPAPDADWVRRTTGSPASISASRLSPS